MITKVIQGCLSSLEHAVTECPRTFRTFLQRKIHKLGVSEDNFLHILVMKRHDPDMSPKTT